MNIGLLVYFFPCLSETFILNQITGLIDLGHHIEIFAMAKPEQNIFHNDIEKYKLMDRVHYLADIESRIPNNKVARLLKALFLMISYLPTNSSSIAKSLNIIQYGKDALSLRLFYRLTPFFRKRFDVLYCHYGLCGNFGAYLKKMGIQSKLVTMFHGADIRLGINEGGTIYSELFEYGDLFLSISEYNYENLIRFGAPAKKIISHPVGIEVNKFPFRWSSDHTGLPKPIILLTVARLVEEKGIAYGIQAFSKLLKRNPGLNIEYWIIGEGPLGRDLRGQVEHLNLEKLIRFLGPMTQDDVIRHLKNSHIYFLPSVAEALPVVLMEAQAIGLPVIATNVGSVKQLVHDGKTGFIVPCEDVCSMVEKLEYLIKNPETWVDFGKAGRAYIKQNYDVNKLNRKLVEILEKAIYENQN